MQGVCASGSSKGWEQMGEPINGETFNENPVLSIEYSVIASLHSFFLKMLKQELSCQKVSAIEIGRWKTQHSIF